MIIPTDAYPNIIRAKIKNHKTGGEEDLIQKPDYKKKFSDCLFKKTSIKYKEYEIRLRFDLRGIDENGNPVLDADFFKNSKKIKAEPHHTHKTYDDGIAAYRFDFDKVELILILKLGIPSERNIGMCA
jgi:hypothetical protein